MPYAWIYITQEYFRKSLILIPVKSLRKKYWGTDRQMKYFLNVMAVQHDARKGLPLPECIHFGV